MFLQCVLYSVFLISKWHWGSKLNEKHPLHMDLKTLPYVSTRAATNNETKFHGLMVGIPDL